MDRVRPYKSESAATGGSGSDDYPFPTVVNPNEDALDVRGVFFQNDTSADADVSIYRDGDTIRFKDKGGISITLGQLAGGGGGPPLTNITPSTVQAGVTGQAGTSGEAARADHRHSVSTGAPVAVGGDTNSTGNSTALARANHKHALEIATASRLGGVRIGSGLFIDPSTGVLSATGGGGGDDANVTTLAIWGAPTPTVWNLTGNAPEELFDNGLKHGSQRVLCDLTDADYMRISCVLTRDVPGWAPILVAEWSDDGVNWSPVSGDTDFGYGGPDLMLQIGGPSAWLSDPQMLQSRWMAIEKPPRVWIRVAAYGAGDGPAFPTPHFEIASVKVETRKGEPK